MIRYLFSALALVVVVKSSADVDWCSDSLSCYNNDRVYQHTLCLYKNQTNTARCKNITNVQTYPGRFELLKKHNQLRESIATGQVGQWPAAAAMRKLSYDNVLEKIAYRWATQCQAGHDDCRKTKRWPVVGQNVFELKKDTPIDYKMWNPASVVDDWFKAVYVAQPQADGTYSSKDFGFVQMIHDKTEKLGCADVEYEVPGTAEPRYRRLIVCNYGPGLEPDAPELYEVGPTCSNCPPGVRCLGGQSSRRARQAPRTTTTDVPNTTLASWPPVVIVRTAPKRKIQPPSPHTPTVPTSETTVDNTSMSLRAFFGNMTTYAEPDVQPRGAASFLVLSVLSWLSIISIELPLYF